METLKKIGVGVLIALFVLASVYFLSVWLKQKPTVIELKMRAVENNITMIGESEKMTELEKEGIKYGELLEMQGILATGTMPFFSYDKIKIRYYYIYYPCFNVIQRVDELLGDYAELEHIEDVNRYSQEQKDEILKNWGNHIPNEEFFGERRGFPMVIFYGPGMKEENGVKRKMDAIENGQPGFAVVSTGSSACCEKCLMFSACQSLTKKPDICNRYTYQISKAPIDVEPTLPK